MRNSSRRKKTKEDAHQTKKKAKPHLESDLNGSVRKPNALRNPVGAKKIKKKSSGIDPIVVRLSVSAGRSCACSDLDLLRGGRRLGKQTRHVKGDELALIRETRLADRVGAAARKRHVLFCDAEFEAGRG